MTLTESPFLRVIAVAMRHRRWRGRGRDQVGQKGPEINFQVARRMGVVELRLLGARIGFSGLWKVVVDGRSSWPKDTPEKLDQC